MKPKFLAVGKVRRAHGIKGEVTVLCLTDYPDKFKPGLRVYVFPEVEAKRQVLVVENARFVKDVIILKFVGINDRREAELLKGSFLKIPFDKATTLPQDAYWYHQIIGLSVCTQEGKFLGTISDILRTGSNDVYLVSSPEGKEILIPATKEVVRKIDIGNGKMIIEPLPGLLE